MPEDAFFDRPAPDVWSPAENLLHLLRSVGAVASAMRYPKLVLRALFGRARASRRYAEVVELYQARLDRGAKAMGRYLPVLDEPVDAAAKARSRDRLLAGWDREAMALVTALERWNEKELDRLRLPHPLLDKLTVREMLFFTLYHNRYHAKVVRRPR